jgi:hypothetical protein
VDGDIISLIYSHDWEREYVIWYSNCKVSYINFSTENVKRLLLVMLVEFEDCAVMFILVAANMPFFVGVTVIALPEFCRCSIVKDDIAIAITVAATTAISTRYVVYSIAFG